jgi:hypothetical protein
LSTPAPAISVNKFRSRKQPLDKHRSIDFEREGFVAAMQDLPSRGGEGLLALAAEQVKRSCPVGWSDVLDALAAGFPVAGTLVM